MSKFRFTRRHLSIPYILFLLFFVVAPMILIIGYAFRGESGNVTLDNFVTFFQSKSNLDTFYISVIISLANTLLCLLIGYPIAYILSNKKFNKNTVIVMLFIMPMWINFVLRTGATRELLYWIGLDGGNHPIIATMVGMVYNYLPFAILPLYTTMLKMDRSQMEAASDLGAKPYQVFFKVVLPMTVPGIVSAFTMVFMPTMSSYVIADVMSENQLMIIGNLIQLNFDQGLWGIGSAIALIMLVIIGISMFLTRNVEKEENARGGLW